MDKSSTEGLLILTAFVIGIELGLCLILLYRHQLLEWTKTGFWALGAFLLYFAITPLAVVISGKTYDYEIRLTIAGGYSRGIWILVVAAIGIMCFFLTYIRSNSRTVTWGLAKQGTAISLPSLLIILVCFFIAFYSLLAFRTGLISHGGDLQIINGRFVGDVTGYETIAHVFLFVPTIFMLLFPNRFIRNLGLIIALSYIYLSLPHAWSRFITLSMLIALSLVLVLNKKQRWPNLILVSAIIVFGAALQIRGHQRWSLDTSANSLIEQIVSIPENAGSILSSADTGMLATWYLESYIKDTVTGYDYGLPLINYVLTGWIPGRFLPDKYFLVDWLKSEQRSIYSPTVLNLLFGAKSSLLGSFYANGGLVFVIFEMILMGYLCRKMDGMLDEMAPLLIKALGIGWISILWMVWGSADFWGLSVLGVMAIPALMIWLVSPKYGKYRKIQEDIIEINPKNLKGHPIVQ